MKKDTVTFSPGANWSSMAPSSWMNSMGTGWSRLPTGSNRINSRFLKVGLISWVWPICLMVPVML